ncbi:MAG TPA: potassium-transporting ATPase subunit KdpA [Candidatus Anoxymicrobiaceae bacterium]
MTVWGWIEIAIVTVVVTLLVKPVGTYLYKVFEGKKPFGDRVFGPIERFLFRILSIDPRTEYGWSGYIVRMIILDFVIIFFAYLVLRVQGHLPLNPVAVPGMHPDLAFNTSISFGTNTNWQAYAGETQVSYLAQMIVMTMVMFTSAASGLVIGISFMRGISRKGTPYIGNYYADFVRAIVRVLLPLALILAVVTVPLGVIQTLKGPARVTTLEGKTQEIPRGPVASLESIKHLGNNGGGFFNANAAHPFENPNPITNVLFLIGMFLIPASMTQTLGRYIKNSKQGWVLFFALLALFIILVCLTYTFEAAGNPKIAKLGVNNSAGNMEGKESRFGVSDSSVFGATTVSATTGSVNSMHSSYTAMGGMMLLSGMMLNVIYGSCGAGMTNILMYVILTVFIAGLMVGRTPEFVGKKIESREVKLSVIALLAHPVTILAFVALAVVVPAARNAVLNKGPHGLTEIVYCYTSAVANNGSAFAGLAANSGFFNVTTGLAMLVGRYVIFIPMIAVAGSLAQKKTVPPSEGTFRTDSGLFAGLLIGVVVIVSALTFFPVLALGPIAERLGHLF